ncbi:hypothetical protein MMC30_005138 [Trapelia coarctata]|nr:hypothetical protein [Trapelia coarctata]
MPHHPPDFTRLEAIKDAAAQNHFNHRNLDLKDIRRVTTKRAYTKALIDLGNARVAHQDPTPTKRHESNFSRQLQPKRSKVHIDRRQILTDESKYRNYRSFKRTHKDYSPGRFSEKTLGYKIANTSDPYIDDPSAEVSEATIRASAGERQRSPPRPLPPGAAAQAGYPAESAASATSAEGSGSQALEGSSAFAETARVTAAYVLCAGAAGVPGKVAFVVFAAESARFAFAAFALAAFALAAFGAFVALLSSRALTVASAPSVTHP